MALLDPIVDMIKQADDTELMKYLGIVAGIFTVLLGLLVYWHYSSVSWYSSQLSHLDKERAKTRKILRDAKAAKAQQQQVEDILAQDTDFRIGQVYKAIIKKAGLQTKRTDEAAPKTGESVSGKTELQITSTLKGLSMKEVTDFLQLIAQVPQLYTKEITIKKAPGKPTVDVDITVATLEQSLE